MKTDMTLFEDHQIRRIYDENAEIWWFSVIDIVQVLTQQPDYQAARNYWKVLKNRLAKEGSEVVTNCNRLKKKNNAARNGPNTAHFLSKRFPSGSPRNSAKDSRNRACAISGNFINTFQFAPQCGAN
jgi:prophage antirepressor-like protein